MPDSPYPTLPFPNRTDAEIYALLAQSGIRLDVLWAGLKEVLARHLPGQVQIFNAEFGLTGKNAVACPRDYYTAGADLQEKPLPAIVVGGENEFAPLGMQAFYANTNACIWIVTKANPTADEISRASILAHLAWGAVRAYVGGYVNAGGQRLWTGLQPQGIRAIPKQEKSLYSGFFISIETLQAPDPQSASLWHKPQLAP